MSCLAEIKRANALLERNGRSPSKASLIGGSQPPYDELPDTGAEWTREGKKDPIEKALKASLGSAYKPGALLASLMDAGERDAEAQFKGKAGLQALGLRYAESPGLGMTGKGHARHHGRHRPGTFFFYPWGGWRNQPWSEPGFSSKGPKVFFQGRAYWGPGVSL